MSNEKKQVKEIKNMREPDYKGRTTWAAWKVPLDPERPPAEHATLGMWLVHAPGAHAFWSFWWITLIHLRDIEGVKPAVITKPGAQWELMCLAQNPEKPPPDPDNMKTLAYLEPGDWVVQFGTVKTDLQAVAVGESCIRAIVSGRISPDTDYRHKWEEAIQATAEHMAEGKHLPS